MKPLPEEPSRSVHILTFRDPTLAEYYERMSGRSFGLRLLVAHALYLVIPVEPFSTIQNLEEKKSQTVNT